MCETFLLGNDMEIFLVVFDTKATQLGEKIFPELEAFIDHNYVKEAREEEYGDVYFGRIVLWIKSFVLNYKDIFLKEILEKCLFCMVRKA